MLILNSVLFGFERIKQYRISSKEFTQELKKKKKQYKQSVLSNQQRHQLFDESMKRIRRLQLDDIELNNSLEKSNNLAKQAIDQGYLVLQSLQNQGHTLKNASSKLKNILLSLGVSKSLLTMISRRTHRDAFIVYIGLLFVLFLLCFIYYFFISKR